MQIRLTLIVLSMVTFQSVAGAAVILVTDPVGDDFGPAGKRPDLVSATIMLAGPTVSFDVRFDASSFQATAGSGQSNLLVSIDEDQDPGTGLNGIFFGNSTDAGILGPERFLSLNTSGGTVRNESFDVASTFSVVTYGDGFGFTIPVAAIASDGTFNLKFIASRADFAGNTTISDYMTNPGFAPVTVAAVPEPSAGLCLAAVCAVVLRIRRRPIAT